MKLEDFKVGLKVWFMGFGQETEVISINIEEGSWIGADCDGQGLYPLDEVEDYWADSYSHPDNR